MPLVGVRDRSIRGLRGVFVAVSLCSPLCFFFQAEDGIRDLTVTGVQTCALPISPARPAAGARTDLRRTPVVPWLGVGVRRRDGDARAEIGRASCRERV